jgi:hypothetical protein
LFATATQLPSKRGLAVLAAKHAVASQIGCLLPPTKEHWQAKCHMSAGGWQVPDEHNEFAE